MTLQKGSVGKQMLKQGTFSKAHATTLDSAHTAQSRVTQDYHNKPRLFSETGG